MQLFSLKNPTFGFVIASLVIVVGIVMAIVEATSNKPQSGMAVGIILSGVLLAVVVLMLDRLLVRFIAPLTLSLLQIGMIITVRLLFLYQDRSVLVNLENYPHDYFVVFHEDDAIADADIQSNFFSFSKEVIPGKKHTTISKNVLNNSEVISIEVKNPPLDWSGLTRHSRTIDDVYTTIFYNGSAPEFKVLSYKENDSIVVNLIREERRLKAANE